MTEYGHHYGTVGIMHFDTWGSGPFVITDANGKQYRFEDSDRFGPSLITKNGSICSAQPGEQSPFWRCHRIWGRQGRRTETDKVSCVWNEPKPTKFKKISKKHCLIVEDGEEDGAMIEVLPDEDTLP